MFVKILSHIYFDIREGKFLSLASVGHMGSGRHVKRVMSLLFPIVLIKGRKVQRNFLLVLFREMVEITRVREKTSWLFLLQNS